MLVSLRECVKQEPLRRTEPRFGSFHPFFPSSIPHIAAMKPSDLVRRERIELPAFAFAVAGSQGKGGSRPQQGRQGPPQRLRGGYDHKA